MSFDLGNTTKKFPDTSLPADEAIQLLAAVNAPWLVSVSEDGSVWVVKDGAGAKPKTETIDFNWLFPDGSKLTEKKNRHYYEMARQYAWVYRLYVPDASAHVHYERVAALLTFFYWLKLLNVRSLSAVTRDHIDLFADKIAFGREWALDCPQRLHKYLHQAIANGDTLPRNKRSKTLLQRGPIYAAAGVDWRGRNEPNSLSVCSDVLDWLEHSGMDQAKLPPLEDILKSQGRAPSAQTIQAIHRALMPLEELWIWRHQLHEESLKFEPFFRGSSKRAKQLGIESKRHPTIPPRFALKYLSGALVWVLDYAPIILDEVFNVPNVNLSRLNDRLKVAGLNIHVELRSLSSVNSRKVNVSRLVELLTTACFVVIASLTARRLEEIGDLGSGCVETDHDGHFWLKTYIEKSSQRYDQTPIPAAVQKAVECMEKISRSARAKSGSDSIWQVLLEELKEITPEYYLNDLAIVNGVYQEKDKQWKFSAHQFRRFFAVLYFWHYEKGDLPALSHHLRHFDLEMTKRYVTDIEMGKIWKEVEAEWQGEFLRGVIDGSRSIGGKADARLKKEVSKLMVHFRKTVDVVAPQRVLQKLQRLAKRWGSEFRQHVWGTICACPQNTRLSELAKCKGPERTGPIFKNASENLCAACPFAIHTERFSAAATSDLASRKATMTCSGSDTILAELANIQIASLETMLNNGEAMPQLPEESNG